MKVRIGYGLGVHATMGDGAAFAELCGALDELGFDSLWLSERATGPTPDPLVGLSVAAGCSRRLKLGTSVQVLPGRNPLLLAKQWATLDALSCGRALPAFGLGVADPAEQQAFGVAREQRGPVFDEALAVIRRFWTEDTVTHRGVHFTYDGVGIGIRPVQRPPDVWLGGRAPSELRRVGRSADGWLPSFTTPAKAAADREVVVEAARAAGRVIDPEHWGALVAYAHTALPDVVTRLVASRLPGVDPREVVPIGLDALRRRIEAFVAAGFSKLVVVPFEATGPWSIEIPAVADALLDLQD